MDWMFMPYRRYADFSGRSRRKEYWMFFLFVMIVYAVILIAGGGFGSLEEPGALFSGLTGILFLLFVLVSFIPSIAVQVRRLHDQNRTGWWILIGFVPLVGGLILLVFMLLDGTPGENDYGPDPKGREGTDLNDRRDISGGVNIR